MTVSAPDTVSSASGLRKPRSVTEPLAVPEMLAASLLPLIVIDTFCVAVPPCPSFTVTAKTNSADSPSGRKSKASISLSNVQLIVPLVSPDAMTGFVPTLNIAS